MRALASKNKDPPKFVQVLAVTEYIEGYTAISRKVVGKIPKGIVGGFEGTVLQRNLKEWYGRPRTYVCEY